VARWINTNSSGYTMNKKFLEVQEPFFKKVPGRRRQNKQEQPMVLVNNRDRVEWHEGMTVSELLDVMNYSFSLITVTVNGELIPEEDYDEHPVPDDADVGVFHLAHGG
jgi:thiamine biosynthesis protein ThiS